MPQRDPEGKDLASLDWLIRKYAITVLPSVASLKTLRGENSIVAAAEPMIGFGDAIFDRTTQTGTRPPRGFGSPISYPKSWNSVA